MNKCLENCLFLNILVFYCMCIYKEFNNDFCSYEVPVTHLSKHQHKVTHLVQLGLQCSLRLFLPPPQAPCRRLWQEQMVCSEKPESFLETTYFIKSNISTFICFSIAIIRDPDREISTNPGPQVAFSGFSDYIYIYVFIFYVYIQHQTWSDFRNIMYKSAF